MARPHRVEAKLSRLRALRHEPVTPELIAELRGALADASNLVAAEAAEIAGARGVADLAPDLVAAFDRFMVEPQKSDKLCRAKIAIVEALNQLEWEPPDVFLRGVRHVQREPVWGGQQDTAPPLRGSAALGLVRISYPQVASVLADLLSDPERAARLAAVQALGQSGSPAAVPLLRYKARAGDADPAVTGECLAELVGLAPRESLELVSEFLHAPDEVVQEAAAFALAESRLPEAWPVLKEFWPRARHGANQEAVLLAIAMLRLPAALDFLLEVVAGEGQPAAIAALSALAIHRHNEALRERIAAAVARAGDAELRARFHQKFKAEPQG